MKKLCVVTGTRAEYGLLKPLLTLLLEQPEIETRLVVTGAHLSAEFGYTYREIEADGFDIAERFDILLSGDSDTAVVKAMSLAMLDFARYFTQEKFDLLLILGDRYEIFAVATAAAMCRVPIAHVHGGETTQGAQDEFIRHSITKMSALHFTSNREHRRRVIQLGEQPSTVFDVGALGVENIMSLQAIPEQELRRELGIAEQTPYLLITFHPVTLEGESDTVQVEALLLALESVRGDYELVFTLANADSGGRELNRAVAAYCASHEFAVCHTSLGARRYLSAVKCAAAVVGNSSSGIIEVPSLGVPTVNIGDRQKGRMQAQSIINCAATATSIREALTKALSSTWREHSRKVESPYGKGDTSGKMVRIIKQFLAIPDCSLKKEFYDIDFEMK